MAGRYPCLRYGRAIVGCQSVFERLRTFPKSYQTGCVNRLSLDNVSLPFAFEAAGFLGRFHYHWTSVSASLNLPALDASKSLFSLSHVSDVSLWTRPALVKVLPAI